MNAEIGILRRNDWFRFVCAVVFIFTLFTQVYVAQAEPKNEVKVEDFGKSLKDYRKKKDSNKSKNAIDGSTDNEAIRIDTDLVVSDVLVVKKNGNAIAGLRKEDFIVLEDGVPQEVVLFSFGHSPTVARSFILIIDYSGSQLPFIENSIAAAKLLVEKLDPNDRMAIVTDDIELLVGFTKDKKLLTKRLDSLLGKTKSGKVGRSEQYSALIAVLKEMLTPTDISPIIIFQTDGDEIFTLKQDGQEEKLPGGFAVQIPRSVEKDFSFQDVQKVVSESRATIYSIIPGGRFIGRTRQQQLRIADERYAMLKRPGVKPLKPPPDLLDRIIFGTLRQQSGLFEISLLSGGHADFIEKASDAENVYNSILAIIKNRYLIGYYSTNTKRDGAKRVVKIHVREQPEFMIMSRKAYWAAKDQ